MWHVIKPPNYKTVICTVKVTPAIRSLAIGYFDGAKWVLEWGQNIGRVIAWQDLPKPFELKMKEENNE